MTDDKKGETCMTVVDAYTPVQIACRIEGVGIAKANLHSVPLFALSVLAGAFIALGAMFYTVVITDTGMGLGPTRLLGGIAFSLGLVLVVVGGAELFTGNNLLVMGWAHGKIKTTAMLRNWGFAYVGNFFGAIAMVILAYFSGYLNLGGGGVEATVVKIAQAKVQLPFVQAFVSGILCNVLVCLAVWLCFAAHTVTSKILAIVFPISAFVTLGFEHCIANMFFIPIGMLVSDPGTVTVQGFISNIIPVTLGNIVGGGLFVAMSYYLIYLYKRE